MRTLALSALTALTALTALPLAAQTPDSARTDSAPPRPEITRETLQATLTLFGLSYTDAELDLLLERRGQGGGTFGGGRGDRRAAFEAIRAVELPNSVPPALFFHPLPPAQPIANRAPRFAPRPPRLTRPANLEDVAFWPLTHLAELVRTRQVSAVELTEMYLRRLEQFDRHLLAVVTFTDSLAREQARRADREIAAGRYKGPLHGIPYGLKDLFTVPGYPTTWGAMPFKDQVLHETATVARRLEDAGAILVAKLTLGALAMGDVWFGGRTRNPWDTAQGASGSSAGVGSAVAAGAIPFGVGTETLGSIVSPSTRNGVTGLRPSFGRVSRHGAMALSWSMDKAGPMCRNAEDCAVVFDVIRGADSLDPTTVDQPFPYAADRPLSQMKIGYLGSGFDGDRNGVERDRAVLDTLRTLGADLVPIELPDRPARELLIILNAEAAAAFDELTRSDRDSLLVRQDGGAWPNSFRSSRLIPAVEYIQANRVRRLLQEDMRTLLDGFDAYVSPSFAGSNLVVTNLTGHPCVAAVNGFDDDGHPTSITFCGPMYGEAGALRIAKAWQDATDYDERHPGAFGGPALRP